MALNDEKTQGADVDLVEHRVGPVDPLHPAASSTTATVSILDAVRANPRVIMYCVLMTVGPLIYGFDNIIVGVITAMPAFQATYGELLHESYILPALWLSLWNAFVQVGAMIGATANGFIADRFGRRTAFITGGLVGIIAVAIIYTSDSSSSLTTRRGAFLAGKTVLGISLGMLNSTCQTYISEVAPPRLRGPLLSIFTFFLVLGQLIAVSIVFARIAIPSPAAYRVAFASQWAFAGFAVVVGLLVPESPSHLLRRGRVEQARRSFARLHGHRDAAVVEAGVQELARTLEHENNERQVVQEARVIDCFRGSDWRRTRIIFYANTLQQCLGVTLLANSSYFLELGGMSATNALMVLEIGVGIGLPANVISWFAMTILGRRFILLASTIFVGILWASIGVAGCFPGSSTALWFIGIMMMIIVFFYGLGVGGAYPVVGAESSSVRLRAKSQGLGFLVNGFWSWAFNFFVPYMFDADQANLGGKMGFFFAGLCVVGAVVIYIEIPEMKNRTYAELDEMFEKRIPTRQFSTYVAECAVVEKKEQA